MIADYGKLDVNLEKQITFKVYSVPANAPQSQDIALLEMMLYHIMSVNYLVRLRVHTANFGNSHQSLVLPHYIRPSTAGSPFSLTVQVSPRHQNLFTTLGAGIIRPIPKLTLHLTNDATPMFVSGGMYDTLKMYLTYCTSSREW